MNGRKKGNSFNMWTVKNYIIQRAALGLWRYSRESVAPFAPLMNSR
jgi:hypothetical protein